MPAVHRLDAEPGAVRDVFSCAVPAALTVEPGDSLVVHTLDASGHLARQRTPGEERPRMFPTGRGHCLAGPIAVRGARPGQLLSVRLDALRPDGWGYTSAGGRDNVLNRMLGTASGEPAHLLWELDADANVGVDQHGVRVPLAPFLGVLGVAPDEVGEYSTIPPRTVGGGNIDCRELTAGATLYLPVAVPDAFLFLGDGHAAQGDGEAGGTAIECGMTTELTVGLHDAGPLHSVHAVTASSRITFGFSADLNAATGDALAAMLTWMQQLLDVDRHTALALAGVVVDLRVTQVANQAWGVHAVLPAGVLDLR